MISVSLVLTATATCPAIVTHMFLLEVSVKKDSSFLQSTIFILIYNYNFCQIKHPIKSKQWGENLGSFESLYNTIPIPGKALAALLLIELASYFQSSQ